MASESCILISSDARCITCGYSLVGLPQPRCPECGGSFDPDDDRTYWTPLQSRLCILWRRHRQRIINACIIAACVGLTWWMYVGGFSLFMWSPGVVLLILRQWRAALLLLAVNPFTVLLVRECVEYAQGGPGYVRPAYIAIQTPQGSDKPTTRLRGFDPGCGTRDENYWVRSSASYYATRIMHAMTGPPPGAYTGPYPSLEQCRAVLDQRGEVQPSKVLDDAVVEVGAKRYTLPAENFNYWGFVVNQPDPAPVTAAMFQGTCLVVRIPRDQNPPLATVKLFDATTGRGFAVYSDDVVPDTPAGPSSSNSR